MSKSNTSVPLVQPPDDLNDNSFDLDIPEKEAKFYYHGLRGYRIRGPRLIYRTSTDVFWGPSGNWGTVCEMQLLTVHNHDKLGKNNLWKTIREQTAAILDQNQIMFTSIDLVRFRRDKDNESFSGRFITPVTIWIGVLPHSTKSNSAYRCTVDILQVLEDHGIKDIDVGFRESMIRPLACPGPVLYAPVSDYHPLVDVVEQLTTALSLPIAGLTTPQVQGTLGFYFQVGEDLYGVTSRHVLFPPTKGNVVSDPEKPERKYVVLMGTQAFKDLYSSVLHHDKNAEVWEFLETLQNDWSDIKNRIIGHVVWSPPISGLDHDGPSAGYMRDVCVIKLYKNKFLPNLRGNVIDLGLKGLEPVVRFLGKLFPSVGIPSEYDFPYDRLYRLKETLTLTKLKEANIRDSENDPTRFVFKIRGPSTGTTLGRLNAFMSHVRRYTSFGTVDSIEAAVFPYAKGSDSFSNGGDSGAVVLGSDHEFVAQITAGTGSSEHCDIVYGTPMKWLWEKVIKPEFPDAVLFFDPPATGSN